MNNEERWNLISELCSLDGVKLFDIEGGNGGVLRVYLTLDNASSGEKLSVQHSHCSAVSNRILNHARVEEILPGNTILEVSSPGVNRKLTRPEHFPAAVGERVKISFKDEEGKKTSVIGQLETVTDQEVVVANETKPKVTAPVHIVRNRIVDARVDFKF